MKKIFSLFILILLILIVLFASSVFFKKKKIKKLEKQLIELMEVQVPLKFRIDKRENDTIWLKVKYYDLDEIEISEKTYQLIGTELAFDFYVSKVNGFNFAFPYKIFTDKIAPKHAYYIANDYNTDGFPAIFTFADMENKDFEFLSDKYEQILQKNLTFGDDFGNSLHDIKELRQFKIATVYKIIVHSKGGIEVLEN